MQTFDSRPSFVHPARVFVFWGVDCGSGANTTTFLVARGAFPGYYSSIAMKARRYMLGNCNRLSDYTR